MFEQLESRRMMSATMERGVLNVRGTNYDDRIEIEQQGALIIVTENGRRTRFAADAVRSIVVNARGGNDSVAVIWSDDLIATVSKPLHVSGGYGNDTIFGGGGRDILLGEAGDDELVAFGDNDTLVGGPGKDVSNGISDDAVGFCGTDVLPPPQPGTDLFGRPLVAIELNPVSCDRLG